MITFREMDSDISIIERLAATILAPLGFFLICIPSLTNQV
jgi:hypothetical protein